MNTNTNIKVILAANGSIVTVTPQAVITYDGIEHFLAMTQINDGVLIDTVEIFNQVKELLYKDKNFVNDIGYRLSEETKRMLWSPNSQAYEELQKAFCKLEPESLFAFIEANYHIDEVDVYQILSIKKEMLQDKDDAMFLEGCAIGIDCQADYNKVSGFARGCWTSLDYRQMQLKDVYQKYCPLLRSSTYDEPDFSSESEEEYEATVEAEAVESQ